LKWKNKNVSLRRHKPLIIKNVGLYLLQLTVLLKMKKIHYDAFVTKYNSTETAEQKQLLLKDFMLSMSFEELMDWNNFLSDNIDVLTRKNIEAGLTEADKEFYRQQFARFDNLMLTTKPHKVAA
jgi:hypothetical protein